MREDMDEEPMREEDVLAEQVTGVLDTATDKIIDVMWGRCYENRWVIYREAYSQHPVALAYRKNDVPVPERFATFSNMFLEKIFAEVLYEGLSQRLL